MSGKRARVSVEAKRGEATKVIHARGPRARRDQELLAIPFRSVVPGGARRGGGGGRASGVPEISFLGARPFAVSATPPAILYTES